MHDDRIRQENSSSRMLRVKGLMVGFVLFGLRSQKFMLREAGESVGCKSEIS